MFPIKTLGVVVPWWSSYGGCGNGKKKAKMSLEEGEGGGNENKVKVNAEVRLKNLTWKGYMSHSRHDTLAILVKSWREK